MKFLVYAHVDQDSIGIRLGTADYSYFFLLRSFAKVLADMGDVVHVRQLDEMTRLHHECVVRGERCVVFSFTPPHKTPVDLGFPVIPVFAWEYPDIPEEIEEESWLLDPRNDWRHVFHRTGRAIALSTHTVGAVRKSMGVDYPIAAIPSPLWQRPLAAAREPGRPGKIARLSLNASVADSRQMGLSDADLISEVDEDGTLFHPDDDCLMPPLAPRLVRPSAGQLAAIEREGTRPLDPHEYWTEPCSWEPPPAYRYRMDPHGVVYTAVLTPEAGRKNWADLLTAFCWAFRDNPDVTLILKIAGSDLKRCHLELLMWLSKLMPFQCRVISVAGYLTEEDYASLLDATTYYVNTSLAEGLCLPLVEFLGEGIPAIAPNHTAMADYINDDFAFVVASHPGVPTVWPHGDMEMDRTSFHQLEWKSLFDAFRRSYQVACSEPETYAAMSLKAHEAMRNYCGPEAVKRHLQRFLADDLALAEPESRPHQPFLPVAS